MARLRVLIVDDHQLTRAALSGIVRLDPNLLLVGVSDNGEVALQAITMHQPDIVCLDVLMPGMDGWTVLERIRKDHPKIRVVMITGDTTPDSRKQAAARGAHGFVAKPFNASDILTTIQFASRSDGPSAVPPN